VPPLKRRETGQVHPAGLNQRAWPGRSDRLGEGSLRGPRAARARLGRPGDDLVHDPDDLFMSIHASSRSRSTSPPSTPRS